MERNDNVVNLTTPPPAPPKARDVRGRHQVRPERSSGLIDRLFARLRRFLLRHQWLLAYERSLNRRAEVEQELFDASRGKRPMPSPAQLHKWATKLGVPDEWRDDAEAIALRRLITEVRGVCDGGGLLAHAYGVGELREALAAWERATGGLNS